MGFAITSGHLMSMAVGASDPSILNLLFDSGEFGNESEIKAALASTDFSKALTGAVCWIISQEVSADDSKFSISEDNKIVVSGVTPKYAPPNTNAWLSFISYCKKPKADVTLGAQFRSSEDLSFDAVLSQLNEQQKLGLAQTQVLNPISGLGFQTAEPIYVSAFMQSPPDVGNFIVYSEMDLNTAFISKYIRASVSRSTDKFAPANKNSSVASLNPRLVAKAVAEILNTIDADLKKIPSLEKTQALQTISNGLNSDFKAACIELSQDSKSEFFNKSPQEISNIITTNFFPKFGAEFVALPNELSTLVNDSLNTFKETLSLCAKLKQPTSVVETLRKDADTIAENLNFAQSFVNVDGAQLTQYGFSTDAQSGKISFNYSNTNPPFSLIKRPNPAFAVPALTTIFKAAVGVLVLMILLIETWKHLQAAILERKILIETDILANAEADVTKACAAGQENSQACLDAKAKVNASIAKIAVLEKHKKTLTDSSILGSLANRLNSFADSLAPILKVVGWTLAGAVAIYAYNKVQRLQQEK